VFPAALIREFPLSSSSSEDDNSIPRRIEPRLDHRLRFVRNPVAARVRL